MILNAIDSPEMAALYGLVLVGGRSVRMGRDKGAMVWHGTEQRVHAAGLLSHLCEKVFISCRSGQEEELAGDYPLLVDSVEGSGPIVGLLTAFEHRADVAWLVLACDLPLITEPTLAFLTGSRDENMLATTFRSPFDGLPEPLVTIWEPGAASVLRQHMADGYKCPRKALIRNEHHIKVLSPPCPEDLMNTNTPDDAEQVLKILGKRAGI